MNKLTKLTINKFRNVKPTTLEFRPGINVVLGKNAAGKTTLLRLLATVMGADDDALQDDVLDVSCHASGAELDFEHTLIKEQVQEPSLSFNKPGLQVMEARSTFHRADSFVFEKNGVAVLRAELLPNAVRLERAGEWNSVEHAFSGNLNSSLMYALMVGKGSHDLEMASSVSAALGASAGRMDESIEGLDRLLKVELKKNSENSYSAVGYQGLSRLMLVTILEGVMKTFVEGTSITFPLEFLSRAAKILGYDSANARFDTEHIGAGAGQRSVRFSNLRFFFKRTDEEVSHERLSYGQKRLLAFFAHVDASGDVVIADELVNGLHHEWISACLKEIGDRQAFLTSQNPLLLDFLRFDSAEEVRQTFILCERVNGEAGAQLVWRNPTEEEADSFFSAYQTGIQRVSDILLTKGLW